MGDTAIYAVLPTHTAAAGVSLAAVGILLSANRWVRLATNGAAGWAYDRWPRRRLFVPALFVGALSTALYAFTTGFWPLLIGRLLWGLAWSGIWVGGNHMMLEVTGAADRGRWTGLYQLSFYLGGVLGFPAGGLLTDLLGFQTALAAAAALTLVGAVAAWIWLPETRSHGLAQAEVARQESANAAPDTHWRASVQDERGRRTLAPITWMYGLNRFVNAGIITGTLALWVQQRWGAASDGGQASLTGLLLGLSTFVSMLTAPLAGHWSDRRAGRWRVAAALLLPGVLGTALLAAGVPLLIVLAVPLNAVAAGSSQGLATALLGDAATPAARGRALGWVHTFGDLTSALAPTLAYWALPFVGLPGLYAACALLLAGMAVWAWTLSSAARG
jgi:MFS family permease